MTVEPECEMFGELFWPHAGPVPYTLDEIAAAAYFFNELDRLARMSGDKSAESRGMSIRRAKKWLQY